MYHKIPKEKKFFIDQILSPIAIVAPLFTLPQAYEVWFLKQTEGVSVVSWSLMTMMALLWFIHAYKHRDTLLMINTFLMIFLNSAIALGAFLF